MSNKKVNYNEAFSNTNYVVYAKKYRSDNIIININKHNEPLFNVIPNLKSWAFITAWNPLPQILSDSENKKRNKKLEIYLKEKGYNYANGIGVAQDKTWQEESFFIENISEVEAKKIAVMFGQMAFVFCALNQKAELIFTA